MSDSRSAPNSSTLCSWTSTASAGCCAKASCLQRQCWGTPATSGRSPEPDPPTRTPCCSAPPISGATATASGGSSPIACRHPRGSATRWRTAGSSRRSFPSCSTAPRCTASSPTSTLCAKRSSRRHRMPAPMHASWFSPPAPCQKPPTTRHSWRACSASRSCRGQTSSCETARSG